jgi:glucokinase
MPDAAAGMVAVDLGGTRLRAAVFDAAGELRAHVVVPTPRDDPMALPAAMREAISEAALPVAGAVVGVPGVIDYAQGTVVALPQLPLWGTTVTARWLAEQLALPVALANDADLAALGELHFGAGRGVQHLVYVTCSTGVGAGVVIGGRLLHSRYSLAEVGHTIIDWRSGATVETFGSGSGLFAQTGESAEAIAARAEAGDAAAAALFQTTAEAFAVGVLTLVRCFMPDRVVVGGGLSQTGERLLGPVRALIARMPYRTLAPDDIVLAECGDDAGLRGAFARWRELELDRIRGASALSHGA